MNSHMDEELKQIQAQQLAEFTQQIKQLDKRLKKWVKADEALNRDINRQPQITKGAVYACHSGLTF